MAENDGFEGVDRPVVNADAGDDMAAALAAIEALGKDDPTGDELTDESTTGTDGAGDTQAAASRAAKDPVSDTVKNDPQGVVAADGKNIIPYDVLKTTRERADTEAQRAQAAEEAARSAQEQLAAAQVELEQLRAGKDAAGADKGADRAGSSERITQLRAQADAVRDELPAMAGVIDGMIEELESVAALRATLEERDASDKTQRERVQQDAAAQAAQAVRATIDSNPTLALWETHKDPTAWNTAAGFEQQLRENPAWQDKPRAERFAKAVELTLAALPDAPKPATTLSAVDIKARARKAVENAGEFEPGTLTDLPAGASPGADPLENLGNADVVALGRRMENMTQTQVDELLSRLG